MPLNCGDGGRDGARDVGAVGHVGRQRQGGSGADLVDVRGRGLDGRAIAIDHRDVRALAGQVQRHGLADAAGRAGDQRGLAVERHTSSLARTGTCAEMSAECRPRRAESRRRVRRHRSSRVARSATAHLHTVDTPQTAAERSSSARLAASKRHRSAAAGSPATSARTAASALRRQGMAPRRASPSCASNEVRWPTSAAAAPRIARRAGDRKRMAAGIRGPTARGSLRQQRQAKAIGDAARRGIAIEVIAARPVRHHGGVAGAERGGDVVVMPAAEVARRHAAAQVPVGDLFDRPVTRLRRKRRLQIVVEQPPARAGEELVEHAEQSGIAAREEEPVESAAASSYGRRVDQFAPRGRHAVDQVAAVVKQPDIEVARDLKQPAVDPRQLRRPRQQIAHELRRHEVVKRTKPLRLRWRVLGVRADEIERRARFERRPSRTR